MRALGHGVDGDVGLGEAACASKQKGGPRMQSVLLEAAKYVPSLISVLVVFVLVVAGTTVAFLMWRASRGPSES
jgi:hypothetical protein